MEWTIFITGSVAIISIFTFALQHKSKSRFGRRLVNSIKKGIEKEMRELQLNRFDQGLENKN